MGVELPSGDVYSLHITGLPKLRICEVPHHITAHSFIYMQIPYAVYVLEAIRPRIYCNMFMPVENKNSFYLKQKIQYNNVRFRITW